jgi:hypothetical protein
MLVLIREYFWEWWQELWNSESLAWKITDRILFPVLPAIALLVSINRDHIPQVWRDAVMNIAVIIPLAIWLVFILFVIQYRLFAKYKQKFVELNNQYKELARQFEEAGYSKLDIRKSVLRAIVVARDITPKDEDIVVIPKKDNGLQFPTVAPQELHNCLRKLQEEGMITLVRFPDWALEPTGDLGGYWKLATRTLDQSDYSFTVRTTPKFI